MELIGVMAVIAIMAGALAPNIFDSIDRAYADAESQNLQSLAGNLESYILENQRIPTAARSSWVPALASVSEYPEASIEFNQKNFRRRLIADPRFFTSSDSQFKGFVQNQGLTTAPVSPRIMLVSDMTRNVPKVANQFQVFDDIWNQSGTPVLVESDDLKIERINLTDIFHRLILSNQNTNQPYYQLESGKRTALPAANGSLDGSTTRFVLGGTRLNLFEEPYPSGSRAQSLIIQSALSLRYQTNGFSWNWGKQ